MRHLALGAGTLHALASVAKKAAAIRDPVPRTTRRSRGFRGFLKGEQTT